LGYRVSTFGSSGRRSLGNRLAQLTAEAARGTAGAARQARANLSRYVRRKQLYQIATQMTRWESLEKSHGAILAPRGESLVENVDLGFVGKDNCRYADPNHRNCRRQYCVEHSPPDLKIHQISLFWKLLGCCQNGATGFCSNHLMRSSQIGWCMNLVIISHRCGPALLCISS
jgi:hypothetical protein